MRELAPFEKETIIRCSAADSEWDICTADPRMIRYLTKRGYLPQKDHQFSEPYQSFTVPYGRLRFLTREKKKVSQTTLLRRFGKKTANTIDPERSHRETRS